MALVSVGGAVCGGAVRWWSSRPRDEADQPRPHKVRRRTGNAPPPGPSGACSGDHRRSVRRHGGRAGRGTRPISRDHTRSDDGPEMLPHRARQGPVPATIAGPYADMVVEQAEERGRPVETTPGSRTTWSRLIAPLAGARCAARPPGGRGPPTDMVVEQAEARGRPVETTPGSRTRSRLIAPLAGARCAARPPGGRGPPTDMVVEQAEERGRPVETTPTAVDVRGLPHRRSRRSRSDRLETR